MFVESGVRTLDSLISAASNLKYSKDLHRLKEKKNASCIPKSSNTSSYALKKTAEWREKIQGKTT